MSEKKAKLYIMPTKDGWRLRYSEELKEKIQKQATKEGKSFEEKFKEVDTALKKHFSKEELSQKVLKKIQQLYL